MTGPEASQPQAPCDSSALDAQALALLLRSPHLSVSQVLELLDLGDREFRDLCARHANIRHLLELRKAGVLEEREARERTCPTCGDRYTPYGGARFCSDTCAKASAIRGRSPQRGVVPDRR